MFLIYIFEDLCVCVLHVAECRWLSIFLENAQVSYFVMFYSPHFSVLPFESDNCNNWCLHRSKLPVYCFCWISFMVLSFFIVYICVSFIWDFYGFWQSNQFPCTFIFGKFLWPVLNLIYAERFLFAFANHLRTLSAGTS